MRIFSKALAAAAVIATSLAATSAMAAETVKLGAVIDPGFEAVLWAVQNKKVSDPAIEIEVEMMPIPALIQAMMNKQYDIVPNGIVGIKQMRDAGLDVKVLGTYIRYHSEGHAADLWVLANSGIKSAEDLKGKRVAVTSIEAQSVISIRAVLEKKYGMNSASIGGDIKWVQIPTSQFDAAIKSGEVDAVAFSNVLAYKIAETGEYRSVLHGSKELDDMFGGPLPSLLELGYTDRVEANPELYEAAAKLLRASSEYAMQHPDEVFGAVAPKYDLTPEQLKGYFTTYSEFPMALNETDGPVIEKAWKTFKEIGSMDGVPESFGSFVWKGAIHE